MLLRLDRVYELMHVTMCCYMLQAAEMDQALAQQYDELLQAQDRQRKAALDEMKQKMQVRETGAQALQKSLLQKQQEDGMVAGWMDVM